jgi:hypothetical protein
VGSCEHNNEPSGSIKGGEFLDQLGDYQILKKKLEYNGKHQFLVCADSII